MKNILDQIELIRSKILAMKPSGFGLIETMISIALLGILALGVGRVMSVSVKVEGSVIKSQELQAIRKTLIDQFDCNESLGIAPGSPSPICGSFAANVPIKRRSGESLVDADGKIGKWSVSAKCLNDEIIFSVDRQGANLNSKTWTEIGLDLFEGTSEFCRSQFDPSSTACSGDYPVKTGSVDNRAICCRQVTASDTGPGFVSRARCSHFEYLHTGGGDCRAAGGKKKGKAISDPKYEVHAYSLSSDFIFIDNKPAGWVQDCHGIPVNVVGPFPIHKVDVQSSANAICCPY